MLGCAGKERDTMTLQEIRVEMGTHQRLTIDKLFGPTVYADLRISCDSNACEWVIERESRGVWSEVARIPGQLESDFAEEGTR